MTSVSSTARSLTVHELSKLILAINDVPCCFERLVLLFSPFHRRSTAQSLAGAIPVKELNMPYEIKHKKLQHHEPPLRSRSLFMPSQFLQLYLNDGLNSRYPTCNIVGYGKFPNGGRISTKVALILMV